MGIINKCIAKIVDINQFELPKDYSNWRECYMEYTHHTTVGKLYSDKYECQFCYRVLPLSEYHVFAAQPLEGKYNSKTCLILLHIKCLSKLQ